MNVSEESIFGAVASRREVRIKGRKAVSDFCGGCMTSVTYGALISGALSLSARVSEGSPTALLLRGGGGVDAALALMTASRLRLPLILCDGGADVEAIDGMLTECNSVFAISDSLRRRSLDISELRAAVAGGLSVNGTQNTDFRGSGFLLSFMSAERLDSYSESALIGSARQLAGMSLVRSGEVTLSELAPAVPLGLVCVLLTSLLSGGAAVFMEADCDIESAARIARPCRLLCSGETAIRALAAVERDERGEIALPVPYSPVKPSWMRLLGDGGALARRRRLYSGRLMRLGGELRHVTVTDEAYPRISEGFSDLGILTERLLSANGCPFVGLSDRQGADRRWRIPRGLFADMCSVGKGGVGRLTLQGSGVCIPSEEPRRHGCEPGDFRFDSLDGISLVTDLWGYVLPDGDVFVKKQ